MAKPTILTVDDDAVVLRAIERDLEAHFGVDFRIVAAESGPAALAALATLKLRNDPVALLLVDQRMPDMTGVELLEETLADFPDSKRALLTAYADTEAAIAAINEVKLDYYIMKPWDPPEERLYPILDDLLEDWRASYRPPFEGIRVIEHRWSRESHRLKEFLARNQIPYQALDADAGEDGRRLIDSIEASPADLPLVLFADGSHLAKPSNVEIADRVGLRTRAELPSYDLIIVGAGPAGLAAAVYGASEGLETLLIEKEAPGGQAGRSARIENYLGFPAGLSGEDLARRAVTQAARFGAEVLVPAEAVGVTRNDPYRILRLADGTELSCKALVVATGVAYRELDLPGFTELTEAGIYYGASQIEATAHQGEDVFVVGGGNSAGQSAMYLSRFAETVTVLARESSLSETMSRYLIDALEATDNIRIRPGTELAGVAGDGHLRSITFKDIASGTSQHVDAGAVFVFVGQSPRTDWVAGVVERDDQGFILSATDSAPHPREWPLERAPFPLETTVPGIFVAGDVRAGSIKRVASATGEGAMAVRFVHEHLAGL